MRVYLPATLPLLRTWLAAGQAPAGTAGRAVTPALRGWYNASPSGDPDDDEELEWAASVLAARDCLALLAEDPSAPRRRVVVAVDIAPEAVTGVDRDPDDGSEERGAVLLAVPPSVSVWAAALVDEEAAGAVVIAAIAALPAAHDAADGTHEDALLALGDADDAELLWWAPAELAALV